MKNETIIYLIRHSRKLAYDLIDNKKNNEYYQTRREKIVLSSDGEKRAEKLANESEFDNIDIIYSSNYARTIQTAKYLAEKKKMTIHIDERFNERNMGIIEDYAEFCLEQYFDENLKKEEGESRKEVTQRMNEAFWETVEENKGKNIAVFTHCDAMFFLLMKWCKLEYIGEDKRRTLSFNGKIILDKEIDAPEVFKITINNNNNEIIEIKNLEFEY